MLTYINEQIVKTVMQKSSIKKYKALGSGSTSNPSRMERLYPPSYDNILITGTAVPPFYDDKSAESSCGFILNSIVGSGSGISILQGSKFTTDGSGNKRLNCDVDLLDVFTLDENRDMGRLQAFENDFPAGRAPYDYNLLMKSWCLSDSVKANGKCDSMFTTPVLGKPVASKCARMGRNSPAGRKCKTWFDNLGEKMKDSVKREFCDINPLASECACLKASVQDPNFDKIVQLAGVKEAPVACWYGPCAQQSTRDIFITSDIQQVKANCPDVCKAVVNAAENAQIDSSVINPAAYCGEGVEAEQKVQKYRTAMYGAVIVAVIVVLGMLIYYYSAKSRK